MTITIVKSAPYLAVQDLGRRGYRDVGVPASGAMDPVGLAAANVTAGNSLGAAALEWALGGGSIRFDAPCSFALAGATADALLDGAPVETGVRSLANDGSVLEIGGFPTGRFLYIGIAGGIEAPEVLGSRATYLPAHLGGWAGRLLKSGDVLPIGKHRDDAPRREFRAPADLGLDYSQRTIRVVRGPQWDLFSDGDREIFLGETYSVDAISDRTGYRLKGLPLATEIGSMPSEAVCPGTIQVPPNGLPIVLMADAPTVGGYAKIAVVASSDLPLLAQLRPGEGFRFQEVPVEEAQRRRRRMAASLYTIQTLAVVQGHGEFLAEPWPSS